MSPQDRSHAWPVVLALVLTVSAVACKKIDPTAVLEAEEVVTGWYDAGIVEGKNKLVPSVSLKLRNTSSEPINSVQINAVFRRNGEDQGWGDHFGWAIPRDEPLAPGTSTAPIVLRSQLGYTGEQPRAQMLQNKEFVDARVEIFLRRGSQVWAKLGEFPIARQLLTK